MNKKIFRNKNIFQKTKKNFLLSFAQLENNLQKNVKKNFFISKFFYF